MDLKDFQNQLIDKALKEGFTDSEVYFQSSKTFEVIVFNGELDKYENSILSGVSFRGTYNGKVGYAFSEKIDTDVFDFLINEAKQNSQIINNKEVETLFEGSEKYLDVDGFNTQLQNLTPSQKIQASKDLEKYALQLDSRIKTVDYNILTYIENEMSIKNSKGLDVDNKSNYIQAYISTVAQEGNQTKAADRIWIGNDWNKFNPKALSEQASKEAISLLGANSIKSGDYPIILRNNAASDLLQTFINVFFADNVQKGFSMLANKLNQKIANDIVNIKDDAICDQSIFKIPFDSEGVATYNKAIIENGVLKTYLHNRKTAKKDNIKSTGNGFKANLKSQVEVAATNFYIAPTNTTKDELIKNVDNGILIIRLDGLHSGANPVSGDFSLMASGYLIENGQITKPVEQITIAGNFLDLLNNIQQIGNDLQFNNPSYKGIIGSPSLYIKALSVAGL